MLKVIGKFFAALLNCVVVANTAKQPICRFVTLYTGTELLGHLKKMVTIEASVITNTIQRPTH